MGPCCSNRPGSGWPGRGRAKGRLHADYTRPWDQDTERPRKAPIRQTGQHLGETQDPRSGTRQSTVVLVPTWCTPTEPGTGSLDHSTMTEPPGPPASRDSPAGPESLRTHSHTQGCQRGDARKACTLRTEGPASPPAHVCPQPAPPSGTASQGDPQCLCGSSGLPVPTKLEVS